MHAQLVIEKAGQARDLPALERLSRCRCKLGVARVGHIDRCRRLIHKLVEYSVIPAGNSRHDEEEKHAWPDERRNEDRSQCGFVRRRHHGECPQFVAKDKVRTQGRQSARGGSPRKDAKTCGLTTVEVCRKRVGYESVPEPEHGLLTQNCITVSSVHRGVP